MRTCQKLLPQMSHLDTHMHTRFTRTHIIQHRKTFLCHPIICNRNYCTKINYHNIHNFPQSCFTCHHKPLHTYMIQNTKIFAPYYQLQQKILYKNKLFKYTYLHTNMLHTSLYTSYTFTHSKNQNRKKYLCRPVSCNKKCCTK